MEDSVTLGEHTLPYQWKMSPRRRTASIVIHPERGVVVHTPRRYTQAWVEGFLREKSRWVLKHIARLESERERRAAQSWEQGARLPYLGRSYPLRFVLDGGAEAVRLEPGGGEPCITEPCITEPCITMGLPLGASPVDFSEQIKERMAAWYRRQAETVLAARVAHYQGMLGVTPTRIRVKRLKRRWGSCSAKGALNFNWQLILAPLDILDYVVVHELCHMLALNHSPRFWGHVEGILPDYRERRRWLRQNDFTLPL